MTKIERTGQYAEVTLQMGWFEIPVPLYTPSPCQSQAILKRQVISPVLVEFDCLFSSIKDRSFFMNNFLIVSPKTSMAAYATNIEQEWEHKAHRNSTRSIRYRVIKYKLEVSKKHDYVDQINRYRGLLIFNLGTFLLPTLHSTLGKLWVGLKF